MTHDEARHPFGTSRSEVSHVLSRGGRQLSYWLRQQSPLSWKCPPEQQITVDKDAFVKALMTHDEARCPVGTESSEVHHMCLAEAGGG
mmetsp:Transcript_10750/g.28571  ORF Transcript_10750/g.28571 Transcript_10750/m.28571 type:complete len:88 (+) Transcript_10750:73-336(+)